MSKFPIDQSQILAATNGGLDIMKRFLDFKDVNKHFKIRKEGTESANLSLKDGVWFVKDWGDSGGFFSQSRHAIHVYSHFTGHSYFESLLELGKDLGLVDEKKAAVKNISRCKFHQFQGALNEDGFCYETKEFTDYELEVLGPLVTPEICERYGLFSLKSYSWLKSSELMQKELCEVFTAESSDTFPIFAFIVSEMQKPVLKLEGEQKNVKVSGERKKKEWLKIYQPKSSDKKYRFSYLGKKPKQHIFGLENLQEKGKPTIETSIDEESGQEVSIERPNKVRRVIICSGDRDSLNMASCGETVVWFNSETADITEEQIGLLFKYAYEVINVPDLDPTGFAAGKRLALEHLDVKTAWLPESITRRKDFRGNPLKDFTDFMKLNAKFEDKLQKDLKKKVERFLELARTGRFWTESWNKRTQNYDYKINYKNAFHFLKLNGFFRIKDENRKDGFYYIKQDGHVLSEVSAQEIKDFFNLFLDEKQQEKGLKYFPDELLNMLIGSEAVSDKKLVNLPTKEFDFADFTPYSQFFFFDKFIWEVTKDEIVETNKGYSRYVMQNDILNNLVRKQQRYELDSTKIKLQAYYRQDGKVQEGNPFFKIKKDDNGNWSLDICRRDCDFMNYLINASRVYWKEEIADLPRHMREEYLRENNFIIDKYKEEGKKYGLSDDQVYEQELHFINKAWSFGYMLHRYKDPSRALVFYAMDNEVVDDSESHGRTGKSLFANMALRLFMNSKYMGARKKNLLESDFLYDGVTEQTDYVLFDDADKRFPFQQLFTDVTGDMNVNPKNQNQYLIPFHLSPKLGVTTNYAPLGLDTSTMERILFVAFSDWYHGETDEYPKHEPKDDFGRLFYSGWDDEQWNNFFNFAMQCLRFYLGCKEKIGAPQGNIKKRNLKAEMGPVFLEWAEEFFADKLNVFVYRKNAYEEALNYHDSLKRMSSTLFKNRVKQFAEYKNYKFNPDLEERKKDSQGRYMIAVGGSGGEEHFYLNPSEEETELKVPDNDNPYD